MKKRIGICLAVIMLILVSLTACAPDTTQLAKEEFSQYYNGKNEVVLIIDEDLYFEDHILDGDQLSPSIYYESMIVHNNSLYYLSVECSNFNLSTDRFNIVSCDYRGNNTNIIFSKDIYTSKRVDFEIHGKAFYIQYVKNEISYIVKYDVTTNTYEDIASGKDCSLSSYDFNNEPSQYTIEVVENPQPKEHGKFYITDSISGITRIVDDVLLKEAGYIESMEKFGYGPIRYDISNGHILLTYQISAGDGWNFPHLVFEYDFESNTLEYKLLAFPYDSVPIEIVYIG